MKTFMFAGLDTVTSGRFKETCTFSVVTSCYNFYPYLRIEFFPRSGSNAE